MFQVILRTNHQIVQAPTKRALRRKLQRLGITLEDILKVS